MNLNTKKYKQFYYHSDHLGSSSFITDASGTAIQHLQYLPYGETFINQKLNDREARYTFSGKEKEQETDYGYFGARYLMSDLSIWISVDPMADKYPNITPYAYCNWNPIMLVDPDGREGIVISGSPGNHKNREHFLVNGLARAKSAFKHTQRKNEEVTWIIYNDKKNGYTNKQIADYSKKATKSGINLKVVSSTEEIIDYINIKNGGNTRDKDKITSFYYVGHATPGDLDVGYQGTGENFEPDDFTSKAFASGTYVNLIGGCNTAVPGIFEDSNVTQFSEITDKKSKIFGSGVKVDYWKAGFLSDAELLKTNQGKIIVKEGKLPVKTE